MRRFGSSSARLAAAFVLGALSMGPSIGRAEVVLHDADGWRLFGTGRVEGHYQLIQGDGDPHGMFKLVGGQIQNSSEDQNNKLYDSRIRSGFVGSQFGLGVSNQVSETLEAKAFVSVWINGIDSHEGNGVAKDVDAREAWGSLSGRYGTFLFGRTYTIFGSASGEVNLYAYEFAVGHPCVAEAATIACGSTGAGPLYAAPNAQLRYITPRLRGIQVQAALVDPSAMEDYRMLHYPRADGEISYQFLFGDNGKLVLKGQGLVQQLAKVNGAQGTTSLTAWGGMGVGRLEMAGLRVGGGAWTGKGMGTHVPFQQAEVGLSLGYDQRSGQLRSFRGFFGNVAYDYHGTALAVGGGSVSIKETPSDMVGFSLLRQNLEYHAVVTHRIGAMVLSAEFMHWKSEWYKGDKQSLNFIGAGSAFVW